MKALRVSDHALLRYMERVLGLDIQACKKEIITQDIKNAHKTGARKLFKDGLTYIFEGGELVTIIKGRPKRMMPYSNCATRVWLPEKAIETRFPRRK